MLIATLREIKRILLANYTRMMHLIISGNKYVH